MLTGGVPFYLDQIDAKESLAKNIDRLCFDEDGAMRKEFDELYNAVFPSAFRTREMMGFRAKRVVKMLSTVTMFGSRP